MSTINSLTEQAFAPTAGAAQTAGPSAATGNAYSDLSSNEFMDIMLQELQNQDPLDPNDSQALLDQISSLRSIESNMALQEAMETLVTQNSVSSASGLIGQYVEGLDANNEQVSGLVDSLRVEDGEPVLMLEGGGRLDADRVTSVTPADALGDDAVQNLLRQLQVLDAGALIGKVVSGLDAGGSRVEGSVTGVRVEPDGIQLELDTAQSLPVDGVQRLGPSLG
jgi:flagellar basal-body rod modification protein FlgD